MTHGPRYAPHKTLPPYSYVPGGRRPHPVRDPAGHSYGATEAKPAAPDSDRWQQSEPYLFGIDLFNHGYYWEAHEVWEGLWHACSRRGPRDSFFKGLIKLAAAGVKARERNRRGVETHARRAAELFRETAEQRRGTGVRQPSAGGSLCSTPATGGTPRYFGLDLDKLTETAEAVTRGQRMIAIDDDPPAAIVFDFVLQPV